MRWVCAVLLLVLVSGCTWGGPDRPPLFDLQAHRGGLGPVSENTLAAFANALELGVTTLELDVQITRDDQAVVTHDRDPNPAECRDTGPAFPGDPAFPYVPGATVIRELTLAQVRTIDCGSQRLAGFPGQRTAPGSRMPLLSEVFDLLRDYGADPVRLNIETKVEAAAPEQTAPRDVFARIVVAEVERAGASDRVTIQSFDWAALTAVRARAPELPISALTNGEQFLEEGQPGRSPWLGGLDIDDFPGSLPERYVAAAAVLGADIVSPVHGSPQDSVVGDPGYRPFTTTALVDAAHRRGMRVLPWTVDDPATMNALLDLGVDGLITDRPDVLRTVLADRGYPLPPAFSRP
ncbi:glycerophosphodiester phosphodiesterase [Nocardia grenadensis]|uniref:glycerophosphodiester phosphodiesterase n=1 Tax=Nocardia grenadensis TaxID=931537 RepID=UPI0007A3715C|nr:glycerophosphodiester phosphodiesterase [Nocardia grenadensis]